jgi:hypothetical protein
VTENALALDPGQRVRCVNRNEHRPGHVLMQIGPTNSAPLHTDLHPAGRWRHWQRNVFDTDIVTAVPDSGTHTALRIDWKAHSDISLK